MMAMSYGYVYVATVAMSANPAQLLKAMNEAEAYHGPSLIIAYAPCINHGINMAHGAGGDQEALWPAATGRCTATIRSSPSRARIR